MERYIWQDSLIILATTPKLVQGVFIVRISDSNCYSFNSLTEKGKRPMTASQEEAEGRAKKPTFRTSNAPLSQEQLQNYEPQNVRTVVGDSAKEPNETDEIHEYLPKRYVGPTTLACHMYPAYKKADIQGESAAKYWFRYSQKPIKINFK
ncbi:hypothetical protein ACHQM5_019423 [Ranunculus cassubicifolius]